MIYTVTFNPAIDYVVRMEKLEIGSVNRSREEALFYGGKGINVSTVLKNLGVDSVALGFVAGFTGKAIESYCVDHSFITSFMTVASAYLSFTSRSVKKSSSVWKKRKQLRGMR